MAATERCRSGADRRLWADCAADHQCLFCRESSVLDSRRMEALGREREDLESVGRYPNRVLELCRQRLVPRHGDPVVRKHLHIRASQIDHLLDGEDHTLSQFRTWSGTSEIQDIRGIVKYSADAGGAEVTEHRSNSTYVWMAWPILPNGAPGRTAMIPASSPHARSGQAARPPISVFRQHTCGWSRHATRRGSM